MTQIIVWPRDLLRPENFSMRITNASVSGGRAPNQGEQVVVGAGGYWQATTDKIGVASDDHVRAYRAVMAALDGRANLCLLPAWDALNQPAPYEALPPWSESDVLWGGDVPWSSWTTDVFVAADAAVRATEATFRWTLTPPLAGQYFSVGQSFHLIARVIALSDTTALVKFRPPARGAFALDDEVNMSDPRPLMRLATDDEGELLLQPGGFAKPTIKWVEANVLLPVVPDAP